jgi:hypothetical protein
MENFTTLFSPSPTDDDRLLGEEITLLAGQINAANYRLLKLIARFDDRKAWSGGGTVRSCAHWLNWKCGINLGAAREKVRVAHCLEHLPLIEGSFAAGEISYSKVRAMTRVATPENEDYLMMIARHGTASHVEKAVAKYKNVTRADKGNTEKEQDEARSLVYYQEEDGSWIIHARLPAEAGSLVVKAIEAVAKPLQREQQDLQIEQRNEGLEEGENVSAETFVAADILELQEPQSTFVQSRADALSAIAEHFLTSSDQAQFQGLKGSERCQVMLHVDIDTLRANSGGGRTSQRHCNLDDSHWISPKTAKRLACDATLVTVLEDKRGKVLNIGRRARIIPASIKRALNIRDKTCRVPGCCQSKYLDAHHIRHWADGGETSLDNLVNLCRHHHRLLHQGDFSIHVEQAGETSEPMMVFSKPSGEKIQASFFPQFPHEAAQTSEGALADSAPSLTAATAVTKWRGESCDYQMVVQGLLHRDGRQSPNAPGYLLISSGEVNAGI